MVERWLVIVGRLGGYRCILCVVFLNFNIYTIIYIVYILYIAVLFNEMLL